jgi:protein-tyrosine-phosphatase
MSSPPITVLFVSRENAVRSILAEACLTQLGKGRFKALSCGVPGQTNRHIPEEVLEVLSASAISSKGLHTKSWNDFVLSGAPRLNLVISLDAATVSLHPSWPGQPDTALWSCAPVLTENRSVNDLKPLVLQTLYSLRRRLELLVALPMHGLDRSALRSDIRDMAHMT